MTESYVVNVKVGSQYVGIPVMRGENGKTPEIRLNGKILQYRYEGEGDEAWKTIFDFSTVETVKGDPGDTPYIGANGNWFTGKTDTGVRAQGDKGDTGDPGKDGADGRTPVRGTDFWTDGDVAYMKSYLETVILNGEW